MLMSGTDNHLAGLGNMAEEIRENQHGPGYTGYLIFRVAALPELLQNAGYHTYMAGKWHLGLTKETSPGARGFEHDFSLLQGGAGHLSQLALVGPEPAIYEEDGVRVKLPNDFYSSRTYSERMIEYLENRPNDGKPFFAYLAFTAPHWPLQAPKESIAKYTGKYDDGYDALQIALFAGMKKLGLNTPGMKITDRLPTETAWDSLSPEDKKIEARKMEIYAAMVDDMDKYLGKVLDPGRGLGILKIHSFFSCLIMDQRAHILILVGMSLEPGLSNAVITVMKIWVRQIPISGMVLIGPGLLPLHFVCSKPLLPKGVFGFRRLYTIPKSYLVERH